MNYFYAETYEAFKLLNKLTNKTTSALAMVVI